MAQSLVKNYVHIIFSTKHRLPLIWPPVNEQLHKYISCICMEMGCVPVAVGGFTDHIHILCMLSKKVSLMKLLEEVKSHSSKWIKGKGPGYEDFYWQNGYGAFSVNPAEVDKVKHYINIQELHHQKMSFQQEFLYFLNKYAMDYDERYIWT